MKISVFCLQIIFILPIIPKTEPRRAYEDKTITHQRLDELLSALKSGGLQRRDACPSGNGNYGFNSFNFMTFMLLVFSLVANVNNNLNNNNNNANKNNINAINQDSNNVASNTNAVNQIMVTVLPIPGKRDLETFILNHRILLEDKCRSGEVENTLGLFYLDLVQTIKQTSSAECSMYEVCRGFKKLMRFSNIQEAFNRQLFLQGESPFLSQTVCEELFVGCRAM